MKLDKTLTEEALRFLVTETGLTPTTVRAMPLKVQNALYGQIIKRQHAERQVTNLQQTATHLSLEQLVAVLYQQVISLRHVHANLLDNLKHFQRQFDTSIQRLSRGERYVDGPMRGSTANAIHREEARYEEGWERLHHLLCHYAHVYALPPQWTEKAMQILLLQPVVEHDDVRTLLSERPTAVLG